MSDFKKIFPPLLGIVLVGIAIARPSMTRPPQQAPANATVSPANITLDLDGLAFDHSPAVLESSAFFVPKTKNGYASYLNDFPTHGAVRIDAVEQALAKSTDVTSFKTLLEGLRRPLRALAQTNKKMIVLILHMPAWLSISPDMSPTDDWWKASAAHGPKNYQQWNELMNATGTFFSSLGGAAQIYYEIWNEPDLFAWKEDTASYLRMYKNTALALRAVDPRGKIGGAGLNGWNGVVSGSTNNLNDELIAYAAREHLPLDFVSWHLFNPDANDIAAAAEHYHAVAQASGCRTMPEWVVSEWNSPAWARGTSFAHARMAEIFAQFLKSGISAQTIAAWEDFEPNQKGNAGYGLITQNGDRKPVYRVHVFFDDLARNTTAVSVISDGGLSLVIARETQPSHYKIVAWAFIEEPVLSAAKFLKKNGIPDSFFKTYDSPDRMLHALATPPVGISRKIMADAKNLYETQLAKTIKSTRYVIAIPRAQALEIANPQAVKGRPEALSINISVNQISFTLAANEVAKFNLCVRQ